MIVGLISTLPAAPVLVLADANVLIVVLSINMDPLFEILISPP